jgi:hypothetical protein
MVIFNLIITSVLFAFSLMSFFHGELIKAIYVLLIAFFEFYVFTSLNNMWGKK